MSHTLTAPPPTGGATTPARGRNLPWEGIALAAILLLAAALYGWNMASGTTNSYYSAAVYSSTQSWKAWFFGSLDAGSFITVDKPPLSTMVQGLFCRVLGFGTWQQLLPMALAGLGTAAVLNRTVRRAFGPVPGLVAALVAALTPITVAITRDNNPDPILVFLMVCAAWALLRAVRDGRLRWLLLCGVFVGLAFNAKMLQAYIVLPALVGVYAYAGPGGWWRRIRQLLAAAVPLAAVSFAWVAAVDLWPKPSRPYIGGSPTNSAWNLVIGYNGLGRVFGGDAGQTLSGGSSSAPSGQMGGGVRRTFGELPEAARKEIEKRFGSGGGHGGGGGGGFSGQSGLGRLFAETLGGQISWLLPLTLVCLVGGLVALGRHARTPRTDAVRAALLVFGGWTVVHFLVFSFADGTMHPYYTTALAPGIAGTVAIGGWLLVGKARESVNWALLLVLGLIGSAAWSAVLLQRTPEWAPWLTAAVALVTLVGVVGVLTGRPRRRLMLAGAGLGLAGVLLGPAAYASATAFGGSSSGGMGGVNPTAGPSTGGGMGFPGGGRSGAREAGGAPGGMQQPPGSSSGRPGGAPNGAPGGGQKSGGQNGAPGGGMPGIRAGGPAGGGTDSRMTAYLEKHQGSAEWLVATSNSQSAAQLILSTHRPVISMYGFTGSDNAMTAAKLKGLVDAGKLKYILVSDGGSGGGPMGGGHTAVTDWVKKHGTKVSPKEYGGSSSSSSSGRAGGMGGMGGSESLYRLG